jgi:hypothetical protein
MRMLGGTTSEGRDDLPDGMAPEGGAWDGVRGRFIRRGWARRRSHALPATPSEGAAGDSVPARTTAGCTAWDGVCGRSRR